MKYVWVQELSSYKKLCIIKSGPWSMCYISYLLKSCIYLYINGKDFIREEKAIKLLNILLVCFF